MTDAERYRWLVDHASRETEARETSSAEPIVVITFFLKPPPSFFSSRPAGHFVDEVVDACAAVKPRGAG